MTTKRNQIESLMVEYDNLEIIQQMYDSLKELCEDFSKIQVSVYEMLPEEEREKDHTKWYLPKIALFHEFENTIKQWMKNATAEKTEGNISVVSVGMVSKVHQSNVRSKSSVASSSRCKAEALRKKLR